MAGSNNVSKNGETKLCKGPLHRAGVRLPLNQFYQSENGVPYSQCIACRNHLLGRLPDSGLISWNDAEPVFERLFALTGGRREAAIAIGLPERSLLPNRLRPKIRVRTFNLARDKISELEQDIWNRGEAEVVLAEPLGSYIRAWVVRWVAERPRPQEKGKRGEFYGPINWLSDQTEIHISRIEQISNGKHPRVPLWQADRILTAMGENYLLRQDIKVIPNPVWSMETWYEHMRERGCI